MDQTKELDVLRRKLARIFNVIGNNAQRKREFLADNKFDNKLDFDVLTLLCKLEVIDDILQGRI